MPTLGNIKWGAQYRALDSNGNGSTKTLNGLNLDESNAAEAESVNAGLVSELVSNLLAFSYDTLETVNLIETRQVNTSG